MTVPQKAARFLALLLVVFCAFASWNRAKADNGISASLMQLASNEEVLSLYSNETGSGYLLTTNALYQIVVHEEEGSKACKALCENTNFIAAFEYKHQVFLLSADGELVSLKDGQCNHEGQIPLAFSLRDQTPIHFCIGDDTFYFAYWSDDEVATLGSYHLEGMEYHEYTPFSVPWCAWDAASQQVLGFVYQLDDASWQLAGFREDTQILQELCPLDYTQYSYCKGENALLLSERYHAYTVSMDGVEKEIPGVPPMDALTCLGKGFYAGIRNRSLCVYSELEVASGEVSILGYSSRYDSDFSQKTGISVVDRSCQGESIMEDVATALVTQDGSIDIFAIWTEEGLGFFKQKGFFDDLKCSPILQEALSEMFPAIQKAVQTDDQRIAAWPVEAYITLMTQDTEMLQRHGFETVTTWEEALDVISSLGKENFFQDNHYVPFNTCAYDRASVLSFFAQEYMLGFYAEHAEITFDTEDFRRLAEKILNTVPLEDPYPRTDGYEDALFCTSYSNLIRATQLAPLRISAEEATRINASFRVLILNPYSPHKDEALRYMEYMATKRTAEDYFLYESMNQPMINQATLQQLEMTDQKIADAQDAIPDPSKERERLALLSQLEQERQFLESERYIVSEEDIQSYAMLSQDFVILENSELLYNDRIEALVSQVAQGAISLDQFIDKADAYVQMVIQEGK